MEIAGAAAAEGVEAAGVEEERRDAVAASADGAAEELINSGSKGNSGAATAVEEVVGSGDRENRGAGAVGEAAAGGVEDAAVLDSAEALDITPMELSIEVSGISAAFDVSVTVICCVMVLVTVSVTVMTLGAAHDVARLAGADVAAMVLLAVAVVFQDRRVDEWIRVEASMVTLADIVADAALLESVSVVFGG
ncbi:hypothetical protein Ptr902_00374 [Pyrenophora tritici-repentis]|nr:hypothetical protein Ptr902_00374 [Pyrenophora tritici-repentis]